MTQQDREQNVVWAQDMQDDGMVPGVGDEDFTKFLDLDNDFQHYAPTNSGHSGLDTPMGRLGFGNNAADLGYSGAEQMGVHVTSTSDPVGYRNQMSTNQQYSQYSQYQQIQMPPQYHVPPTPVSVEMHPGKYVQQMGNNGQILFDHQQVSFTPLVSPAQTPMDGGFAMSDYGLADEFFSPLTSPAIEAQAAFSSTGTTASPVDLNDLSAAGKPVAAGTKRPRRKGSNSARTPARSVKQSPAMKPQPRRRNPSLTSLPMDKIRNMLPQGTLGSTLHPSAPNSAVLQGSDDSVSPEPLSEAAMRPPPVPHPGKSPQSAIAAQNAHSANPVTPATLMRMPSNQSMTMKQMEHHGPVQGADEPMEDIMLPAAAASSTMSQGLQIIDTGKPAVSGENTPTLGAKSAKISAASTPRSALTRATSQETFAKPGKVESRGGGRASKKRQSTSSATISPALRPKISPSISPLAPAAGKSHLGRGQVRGKLTVLGPGMSHLSAETSALYLASKSNYQNILEGTHLPGVSYPETLAENLTSKRTSHKIAEQGRRNRINLALKEIEALLPASILVASNKKDRPPKDENEDGETSATSKPSAPGQGASKASTVEMAIVYIKSLQSELKETQERLEAAEKKAAEASNRESSTECQGTLEA
ncbi:Helix-loop-helix DNA-binding domain-containing protein isoform 3 [Cladophialophora immunda]|nr:Helix-loop-helix DNA-binding domain-containing protein isoform 3 [Cladophialophora immunda]